MKYFFLLPIAIFMWVFTNPSGQEKAKAPKLIPKTNSNPIELGKVNWLRNMETAVAKAKAEDKPIFLLFQEVPGCSTCQNYGSDVLSHPLVVEAIETLFIPLAIHNNQQGYDAKVLKYFGEPSWNNPVVRIIRENKEDLIPRISGNYTTAGLVANMMISLQVAGITAPKYLQLLNEELTARAKGLEEANLAMYCFWSGEKNLGHLEGVIETQAGFMNGAEVVKVKYDPEAISLTQLVDHGSKTGCADKVFVKDSKLQQQAAKVLSEGKVSTTGKFRMDGEPKYYLSHSAYRYVPMTQLQAARANSLLASEKSPLSLLSPRQKEMALYILENPKRGWKSQINEENLVEAWEEVEERMD